MKYLKLFLLFQIAYLVLIFLWISKQTINSGFKLGELIFFFISIGASIIFGMMLFIISRLKNKKQQKLKLRSSIILTSILCILITFIFVIGKDYYKHPWDSKKTVDSTANRIIQDSSSTIETKKEKQTIPPPIQPILSKKIHTDSTTDTRYVYLTEIIESNGTTYIKADYVNYLTGKDAYDAERREKNYFIDGNDTISNITDGHYISNVNPKIRTFKMGNSVLVKNIIDDTGIHPMDNPKKVTKQLLQNYINSNTLIFIHIESGTIINIDELFVP